MRKFLVISIPIVTLLLFVAIMLSGEILKKPFGKDDNIQQSIESLMQDIQSENWEEASQNVEGLEEAWKKVVKRVQFSEERNEINGFTTNMARIKGAIEAKDKSGGLQELYEANEHWEDLGK
jgi:hypothetical protein